MKRTTVKVCLRPRESLIRCCLLAYDINDETAVLRNKFPAKLETSLKKKHIEYYKSFLESTWLIESRDASSLKREIQKEIKKLCADLNEENKCTTYSSDKITFCIVPLYFSRDFLYEGDKDIKTWIKNIFAK